MLKVFQSFLRFMQSIYNAWFIISLCLSYFIFTPLLGREYDTFSIFVYSVGFIIQLPTLYQYYISKSIDEWGDRKI